MEHFHRRTHHTRAGPRGDGELTPLRVALTGGIATGKSYVLRQLQRLGVPTIDADILAREAVAPGSRGLQAVIDYFGQDIVDAGGGLDRRALGARIFANATDRQALEAIIHPAVYRAIIEWFERLPADSTLGVADIPLLFESGHHSDFDVVIVAACDPAIQLERVMARDEITQAEAEQRLAAQWPIADKSARADIVIWTNGPKSETDQQVDQMYARLIQIAQSQQT